MQHRGQLCRGSRPHNCRCHAVLVQQPGQRHGAGALAQFCTEPAKLRQLSRPRAERLGDRLRPASPAGILRRACQQTAGKRAPDDHAQPIGAAGRQHFKLGAAFHQIVKPLLRDQTQPAPHHRLLVGPGDGPSRKVAGAGIGDLALSDQPVHRLPDLFDRRSPVDVVHLVEIDVVHVQALQAGVTGHLDVTR